MRDRFLSQEVWEAARHAGQGVLRRSCCTTRVQLEFRKVLFSKIVPNLKKLGLLDAGDGWLRQKFGELGRARVRDVGGHRGRVRAHATRRRRSRLERKRLDRGQPAGSPAARRRLAGATPATCVRRPGSRRASRAFFRRIRSCFHRTVDRAPRPMGGAR